MDITQWLRGKIERGEVHKDYLYIYTWIIEQYKQENGNGEDKIETGTQRHGIQGSAEADSAKTGDTVKKRRSYSRKRNQKSVAKSQEVEPKFEESKDAEIGI